MSASMVAITANPAVNNSSSLALGTRRRSVAVTEKKSSNIEIISDGGGGVSEPVGGDGKDHSHSVRGEMVLEKPRDLSALQAKRGFTNSTVSPRRRKVGSRSQEKPLWLTVISIFAKNFLLLLVLLGLVQMIRKLALNSGSGDGSVSPMGIANFEGRIAEVEAFLKTTTKMMQVQVEVVDRKIESEVGGLKRELTKRVEEKSLLFENKLNKLEAKTDDLEGSLGELKSSYFTKEDFERFLDELKDSRSLEGSNKDWSLDEIRAFAREIVEKEIERHAADGLGMVDYALASGGAMVVGHSEPYMSGKGSSWFPFPKSRNGVHIDAQKMLQPSFGEPGKCFALNGSTGFVEIRLRTAIIPEAVTLEHVAKSVAYDRSSAPKDCRISAWFQGRDSSRRDEKMFLLTEFAYDLERSNAQTFNVESADSGSINIVRLDFTSNHGSRHTCIYRLRVHGHEPESIAALTMQS